MSNETVNGLYVEEISDMLLDYARIGDLPGIIKAFKLLSPDNLPLLNLLGDYGLKSKKAELWEQTFSTCAKNGSVDVVDYLLNDEKVKPKEDRDIHIINGLTSACSSGNLEMAQYFLNSAECPERAKLSTAKPFQMACAKNKLNIINLFLYDLKIPIEESFEEKLKIMISLTYQASAIVNNTPYFKTTKEEKEIENHTDYINKLISKRDLLVSLKDNLSTKETANLKNKI